MQISNLITIQKFYSNKNAIFINLVSEFRCLIFNKTAPVSRMHYKKYTPKSIASIR